VFDMSKVIVLTVALMLASLSFTVPVVQAEGMADVQLILKKLRSSMTSMSDFDELEKAGMEAADVDRMRRAMKRKIKQMTDDAVDLIRAL